MQGSSDKMDQMALQLGALTEELHQFLSKAYAKAPGEGDSTWRESLLVKCKDLADKTQRAKASAAVMWGDLGERWPRTHAAAGSLCGALDRLSGSLARMASEAAAAPSRYRWRSRVHRASISYEELLRSIRHMKLPVARLGFLMPHFKPMNVSRNIFHIGMGVMALALSIWVLTPRQSMIVMAAFAVFVGILEITRAISPAWNRILVGLPLLRETVRPREMHRVNSASVFAWTLTGVLFLTPMAAVQTGLIVLSFADPAASLIGKRFGKFKLWKQKSLAGTLAFFVVAFVGALLGLHILGGLAVGSAVAGAAAVGAGAAATELFSDRLDDNFTVLGMAAAIAALFL